MPQRRRSYDAVVRAVERALKAACVNHVFVGGIAVIAFGRRRTTEDVGVLVAFREADVPGLSPSCTAGDSNRRNRISGRLFRRASISRSTTRGQSTGLTSPPPPLRRPNTPFDTESAFARAASRYRSPDRSTRSS